MRDAYIGVRLPSELLKRLEAAAPAAYWARSRFVREAIAEKLARLERQAADPSLSRETDRASA